MPSPPLTAGEKHQTLPLPGWGSFRKLGRCQALLRKEREGAKTPGGVGSFVHTSFLYEAIKVHVAQLPT